MEFGEYKAKMAEAIANTSSPDPTTARKAMEDIDRLNSEWNKSKAEHHKVELEAQRKEAEALAGEREKLAVSIHKYIVGKEGMLDSLAKVKSKGFTFKLDEPDVQYKSVSLTVPTIKTKTSSGNGGAGKTKDEFGMSLQEVYDKFHTADDGVKMLDALAKDEAASEKLGKKTNSNAWRVKNEVKKRVLADGLLAPTK